MGGPSMIFLLSCLAFLCQEMAFANMNDLNLEDILSMDGVEMKNNKLYYNDEEVINIREKNPIIGDEGLERLLSNDGMEMKNGKLYYDGEEVKEISRPIYSKSSELEDSAESEELSELDESGGPGDYGLSPPSRDLYERRYNDDILNNVEEVTPIKSIQELKSIQEIKKMLPVKSIQEIKSIKEIESIEEIKDKLARSFIRNHGLKNLINDEGGVSGGYYTNDNQPDEPEDLAQLRRQIIKDSKQCQILKEKVAKKQQEIDIMEEIEDQHCQAAQNELQEYRTLKEKIEAALNSKVESIEPIESIDEVKSITPIKNIEEIESMTSVESIQEVKYMYELTAEQAQQLKDLVNGNHYPAKYGRRRRRNSF